MECAICYEPIKDPIRSISDDLDDLTTSLADRKSAGSSRESSVGIGAGIGVGAKTISIRVIQCPTRKHDLCDPCMIRWIKDSLEQHKDVHCVVCNQRIHTFMHYRREVLQQEREEEARRQEAREAAEIAAAEIRLQQMIRGSLERNIQELNGMMGKLCCWAGGLFGLIFIIFLLYPSNTTKFTYFMIVYIGMCSLIMLGLYLNRLFYSSQLNEMNRIHPERTVESTRLGDRRSPASSRESSTLPV